MTGTVATQQIVVTSAAEATWSTTDVISGLQVSLLSAALATVNDAEGKVARLRRVDGVEFRGNSAYRLRKR